MKRTKTLVIALWAVFVNQVAFSQKGTEEQLVKDANSYFKTGEYLKAFPLYSQLVSLYPNHAEYNYKFGACAIYSDADKTKAVKFLNNAVNKGVEDDMAWYYLGKAYHLNYQFKEAIKAYETFIRNADPKLTANTDAQREVETCIYGSNLLANIKDISVISKTESDKANFFRYFNLESIGGKILTVPDELKSKMDVKMKDPGVIHYPGNGTTIYFSSYGKDGLTGKDIYKAQVLPDGKFSTPIKLEGDVNTKYDEDFCFMHSDGKTLYFSSKGHNSMGGYDIFKSEYDAKEQKFGPAINLDFAINTPDDDIFYIADSLNKTAYFASGRASDLNHLNVYNVMVESMPLQIVYIKGSYANEINPDQKKAGIKIIESGTGRMVCDGISGGNTGAYTMFVPKSGEYTFKVITENSPAVHEVKVEVPFFDKPVAVRQEMKLISENGKDKLIVTNYFETPLDEDISGLAAEMLRKKSNLDVNVSADVASTSSNAKNKPAEGELSTFEKTIENATLAAGFPNGMTLSNVVEEMSQEANGLRNFSEQSEKKKENSLAYALKMQQEADKALSDAENIRKSLGNISSESDIQKLRASVELTDKAKALQLEAKAAMNVAESIDQYKISESERATSLEASIADIKKAESENNYDNAVQALTLEKDRETALRDGNGGSPYGEMLAKAKARESEQLREEQKLTALRDREKQAVTDVKSAQDKLAVAKKEKEKQAFRDEVASQQAELDNVRSQIVAQTGKAEKADKEAKLAYANANFFKRISDETNVGLTDNEQVKLSELERTKLAMRIDELNNRCAALEITDPQMLALVTEGESGAENNPPVSVASNNSATTSHSNTDAIAQKTAITEETISLPAPTPLGTETASAVRSRGEGKIASLPADESFAASRRMYLAQSMIETDNAIRLLESKKSNGGLNADESAALADFRALAVDLRAAITSNTAMPASLSSDELRAAYSQVDPAYNDNVQSIINASGTEIERTMKLLDYKKSVLQKLETARLSNANTASEQTTNAATNDYAQTDQKLESAIAVLYNETSDVNQPKAAYEIENKKVIESDAVFSEKLESQISITESYVSALSVMEAEKQLELICTADPVKTSSVQMQLAAIREEKAQADAKLVSYKHDLQLTASTNDPAVQSNSISAGTLEDAMENSMSAPSEVAIVEDERTTVEKDVVEIEKMFKTREEAESIFAYESGMFEEIVAQHQSKDLELKNRERIQEINDQIFLLEAEMENEPNQGKLRKLDYKAEQLYLKRSLIEIDNSPVIAQMTTSEYQEELAKTNELLSANDAKVNEKIMVKDEIKRLRNDAEINMRNAAEIRAKSPSIQDDIERADYCRTAFAKEALAIDQLRQIQQICEHIDMLNKYDEQQLAMLKTGTIPNDQLAQAVAENVNIPSTSINSTESNIADATGTEAQPAEEKSDLTLTQSANDTTVQTDSLVAGETEMQAENTVVNFSTTSSGDVVLDRKTVVADPNGIVSLKINVEEPKSTAEATPDLKNSTAASELNARAEETQPIALPVAATASAPASDSRSNANASGNAADYYYAMPEVVTSNLFVRTNRAVYSESKPIPVNAEMPKGVYYKVQVGAFKNEIPQNLYDEFAPVCGEKLNNGITRYTAGFFTQFESADQVKKEIRGIGYGDAFVVAFRDGKRIPLYEAMAKTDGTSFAASVEKEYIYGDKGEAPKPKTSVVSSPTSTTSSSSNATPTSTNGDYYKAYPNAAPAVAVETVQGLFFTVQVGVYSKPVSAKGMFNISPLNSELTETKKVRYTSGRYTSMMAAVEKRSEAKNLGIKDAFITAYYNGKRISLSQAESILLEKGPSVLAK